MALLVRNEYEVERHLREAMEEAERIFGASVSAETAVDVYAFGSLY